MMEYYRILEVDPQASAEVIEKAYRVLSRRYHPDVHKGEDRAWATAKMQDLNEAYAVLRDAAQRAEYDARRQNLIRIWWEEGLLGLAKALVDAADQTSGSR